MDERQRIAAQIHDTLAQNLADILTQLQAAQESLTNVAKHAAAERAGLTLSYMDAEVSLDVRDDGSGFDTTLLAEHGEESGFGLAAMRKRALRLAGEFTVESEPGVGTTVRVSLPAIPVGSAL